MSDWTTSPLPEVLDFREGPGIMASDFRPSGVPLVRLAGLKRGANLLAGCNWLDPAKVASRWNQFQLQIGDVLLSTSASLGEVAVVRDEDSVGSVPYTGIIRFRPKDSRIDPTFIAHMLTAPDFAAQVEAMGVGSVMKHFGPTHLKFMNVSFPATDQQRAIAKVLEALDDKIAANTRVSGTCEKLAAVEFALAARDAGATESTFADVATIRGGGTPKTAVEEYWGGAVAWATPTDITALDGPYLESTSRMITAAGLAACSSDLLPVGTILMTSRATIGAFAVAQRPTAVNQGFIAVNPAEPAMRWWLFHEMTTRVEEFKSHANGATFLELPRGKFKQLPVTVPSRNTLAAFDAKVNPLHQRSRAALVESTALAATRDALLFELMSGRIRVRDAESAMEAVP